MLRTLDKIEKEEGAKIREDLERDGLSRAGAAQLFGLISSRRGTDETLSVLQEMKSCAQGLEELRQIVEAIRQFGVPDSAFAVDLGVVRGLDYYTGTIYETTLAAYPELGSICSGGATMTSRATSPTRGSPGSGSRSGSRAFSPS